MHYGLINISTRYQNPDSQIKEIKKLSEKAEIKEDITTLLPQLKENDTVIITDIKKLADNNAINDADIDTIFDTVYKNYQKIFNLGADIIVINQPVLNSEIYKMAIKENNEEPVAKAVTMILEIQIRIMLQESISRDIQKRESIKNGIKTKGGHKGQKKGATFVTKKEKASKLFIIENLTDFGGTMTNDEIMKELHLARNTYYKYKRELLGIEKTDDTKNNTKINTEKETKIDIKIDTKNDTEAKLSDSIDEIKNDTKTDTATLPIKEETKQGFIPDEQGTDKNTEDKTHEKTSKKQGNKAKENNDGTIAGQMNILDFI